MSMDRCFRLIYTVVWPIFHFLFPMKVIGRKNIPEGPVLVCPNHSAAIDPLFAIYGLQKKHIVRVMAKKEVVHWPVLGWILRKAGVFGVDRGSADIGAVKTSLRYLKEGRKLLMFPEGTRVAEGESVDAKTGAAMFSVRAGVPILPVYITVKKRLFRRNLVVFGEPFRPQVEGRKGTSEEYHAIARELMDRIYELGEEMK